MAAFGWSEGGRLMTLRWRIVAVVAAFVVLLFAVAAVGIQAAQQREEVSARLDTTIEPARQATETVFSGLVDQELGLRGYVLSRDEAFLQAYVSGRFDAQDAIDELYDLLGENDADLLGAVADVEDSLASWRENAAWPQLEAVRQGRISDARGMVESAGGESLFNVARSRIQQLDTLLASRHREALAGLRTAQQRLFSTVVVAAMLAVLLAAGFTWLLHGWISRPIEGLSAAVERVAGGALDASIPHSGPAELAALGVNVDHMRHSLVEQLDEAKRARQGLEQQGPAVVALRAALNPPPKPLPGWLAAAAAFAPARGVLAGDWYDLFVLNEQRVAVAVMDVSGHGPQAGVLALRAKEQLGAALHDGQAPGQALASVAANLGDTGERFLTCFVAEVAQHGTCRYASAGHPAALLITDSGTTPLEPTGPLLGPLDGSWHTAAVDLDLTSSLLVYTDGLLEARNDNHEPFETDRLDALANDHRDAPPAGLVNAVAQTLAAFTGGSFGDDLTVVALARQPGGDDLGPSYLQTLPIADRALTDAAG